MSLNPPNSKPFTPPPFQSDDDDDVYQYWFDKVTRDGYQLRDAPEHIRNNKSVVMAAVQKYGSVLEYASPSLQNDKQVVMAAVKQDPNASIVAAAVQKTIHAIQFASPELQNDEDIKEAVEYTQWVSKIEKAESWSVGPGILKSAPGYIRSNRSVVMAAVSKTGMALKYASPDLQNDKRVVMAAISDTGHALHYASPSLKNNKQVVMAAISETGRALEYASPSLQNDRQAVMAAVKQDPNAIKFAHDDLKRDPDVLIASGMYDKDHVDATVRIQQQQQQQTTGAYKRKIVLSTRFSLNRSSRSEATQFTAKFKNSEYIKKCFTVYAPNAFGKKTCDPEWTRFDWPCRGTKDTCQYDNILTAEGRPTNDCCWRYSFRSQLQEAKDTGGFMLQLVETGEESFFGEVKDATLGMGQTIELDMANTMNLKTFQVYRPEGYGGSEHHFRDDHIDVVTAEISRWYDNGCQDMSVKTIQQPSDPRL